MYHFQRFGWLYLATHHELIPGSLIHPLDSKYQNETGIALKPSFTAIVGNLRAPGNWRRHNEL